MGNSVESEVQSSPYRLVSRRGLASKFGIDYSNAHLLRLERDKKFPRRFYATPGRASWLESEVQAWLDDKVRQRAVLAARTLPQHLRGHRPKKAQIAAT